MVPYPISFSVTPPRHILLPPMFGQDNEQIRAWPSQTGPIDQEKRKAFPQ